MEEIALNFTLEQLASISQNEVQLLLGVRVEFEFVRGELQQMKAYLRDADVADQKDSELKELVEQLRDVAFDTEDVIDEFRLHLLCNHRHGYDACLYNIWCFVKNLRSRHRIASRMQRIKSRVSHISYRYKKYTDKRSLVDWSSSLSRSSSIWLDNQGDALLLNKNNLVGIEKPKTMLVEWLIRGDSRQRVISVVGMGGLGKTTLVNQVYVDAEVRKHFKLYAWVTVSQSFKVEELLKDIVRQLFIVIRKPIPEELDGMSSYQLKEKINKLLQHRRYLVVLDDIWHMREWDTVKHAFPSNSFSSRVIITTRHNEVASTSSAEFHGRVYKMEPLPTIDAWSLFCKKTFQDDSCPEYLYEICQSILKICGGLPLAIVAISGVLATKHIGRIDEWEMVSRSLGAEIEHNDKLEGMRKVLSLSFSDLPHSLKSCLLYLSIFPEEHNIERIRLIRLWIAEGFVQERQGKTPEEVAESCLEELLSRSLIQVAEKTSDGRVKTCRVHDLLREIINQKSKDQNFATISKENGTVPTGNVRRLSVINTLQNLKKGTSYLPKLRSLWMFGVIDPLSKSSLSTLFPGGLRLLKVLDLQAAPLNVIPDAVANMLHLKYLSLRETKVSKIPGSIRKLQNLETLDLKHSLVTELPADILKLQKLRHLLVYHIIVESYPQFNSKFGFKVLDKKGKFNTKVLANIGGLQSLQKLAFIDVDQGGSVIMTEIGKLTQLTRLGIINLREECGISLCSSLERLTRLRALSVYSVGKDDIIDLNHLSSTAAPKLLQRIYLTGRLALLPPWISSLHALVKLSLSWSQLKDNPLNSLQHLPNLVHLEFLQAYSGDELHFYGKGFQRLKVLGLDRLDQLKSVVIEKGAMPYLKKLRILRCKLLQKLPDGIENLTDLKLLELFDMPDELIMTFLPGEGEDHWKVADIPEVYSTYFRDDGWDIYTLDNIKERIVCPNDSSAIRSNELCSLWKV